MNPSLCESGTPDYTIYSLCKYLETNPGGCRAYNGKGLKEYENKLCRFI